MKSTLRLLSLASALTATLVLTVLTGFAQTKHPAYLHALTDMRIARAHLEKAMNNAKGLVPEAKAVQQLDEAIADIKKAGIDDGKDLNDHPPVDAKLDGAGLRHRAIELIDKAHGDISKEEDNKFAQGLQQRAMGHLDKAKGFVEEGLKEYHSK